MESSLEQMSISRPSPISPADTVVTPSRRGVTLDTLPPELINQIIANLIPPVQVKHQSTKMRGLASLCLTGSKHLLGLATIGLYRVVYLDTMPRILGFMWALFLRPELQPLIRGLYVAIDDDDEDDDEATFELRNRLIDHIWRGRYSPRPSRPYINRYYMYMGYSWLKACVAADRRGFTGKVTSFLLHFTPQLEHITLRVPAPDFFGIMGAARPLWIWLLGRGCPATNIEQLFLTPDTEPPHRGMSQDQETVELRQQEQRFQIRYHEPFRNLSHLVLEFSSAKPKHLPRDFAAFVLPTPTPGYTPLRTPLGGFLLCPSRIDICLSLSTLGIIASLRGMGFGRGLTRDLQYLRFDGDRSLTTPKQHDAMDASQSSGWNIIHLLRAAKCSLKEVHLDLLAGTYAAMRLYGPNFSPWRAEINQLRHLTALTLTLHATFGTVIQLLSRLLSFERTNPDQMPLLTGFPPSLVRLTLIEWWADWDLLYSPETWRHPKDQHRLSTIHSTAMEMLLTNAPHNIHKVLPDLRQLMVVAIDEDSGGSPHPHTGWLRSGDMDLWKRQFRQQHIAFDTSLRLLPTNYRRNSVNTDHYFRY